MPVGYEQTGLLESLTAEMWIISLKAYHGMQNTNILDELSYAKYVVMNEMGENEERTAKINGIIWLSST